MNNELIISHIHFPILEQKLLEKGIHFEFVENTTGNYAEPSITIRVANENLTEVNNILENSFATSSKSEKAKSPGVGFWALNILGTILIILTVRFAIYEWTGGPEIWISIFVATILVAGMWFIMFQPKN